MKKLAFLGALVCAPLFAADVFDKGTFGEQWQHCFSQEALRVVKAKAPKGVEVDKLQVIGSAYEKSKYIVDLQNPRSAEVVRAEFRGDYKSAISVFDTETNETRPAFHCYVDGSGLSTEDTVFKAYDRENPSNVFVDISGKNKPRSFPKFERITP